MLKVNVSLFMTQDEHNTCLENIGDLKILKLTKNLEK